MDKAELLDSDTGNRRGRRGWRWLQVVLPLASVLVMVGAILTMTMLIQQGNRREALVLSNELLKSLDLSIAAEVRDYLAPASQLAEVAANVIRDAAPEVNTTDLAQSLSFSILTLYPQLTILSFGDHEGNYVVLRRDESGAINSLIIKRTDGEARGTLIRRNPEGEVTATKQIDDPAIDPRERPWYRGAVAERSLFWTEVYMFQGDRMPGITASFPIIDDEGSVRAVLGLDIVLEQLSAFLSSLQIGQTGQALILDESGLLVAYPVLERMFKQVDGKPQPVKVDELGNPVLTRAFDRFRVEGYGRRELDVGGERFISTTSSLQRTVKRAWSVMIVVPEEDFIGFVARSHHRALLMVAFIVGLTTLLAGLAIFQGLRADRNAWTTLRREDQFRAQNQALAELASRASQLDLEEPDCLVPLTELTAQTTAVSRVSVWRISADRRQLVCDDCYDRESGGHTRASLLVRDHLPRFFEALDGGQELVVADADRGSSTIELYRAYLQPQGCKALLCVPFFSGRLIVGWVWLEDVTRQAGWNTQALAFARVLASMLSSGEAGVAAVTEDDEPQLAAALATPTDADDHDASPMASSAMRTTSLLDERIGALRGRISRELERGTLGVDVFDQATVLVVQFLDPIAMAQQYDDGAGLLLVERLVDHLERVGVSDGIEYLKISGDEIVCAAGVDGDPDHGVQLLGDVAFDLQDHGAQVCAELHSRPVFRLGMATGVALGLPLGRNRSVYNLWGESVQVATRMADLGFGGSIQVSETTYRHLRKRYLFRARGVFYLRDVGELKTYILTGRL